MALARTPSGFEVYEPDGEVLSRFFWDRSKMSIIQGPIGSGTSTAGVHKIWNIANEQAPDVDGVRRTRWVVTRNTYKMLDTTILATTWPTWFPEHSWGSMIRSEPRVHTLAKPHWSGDGTKVECEVVFLALPDHETAQRVLASFEITGFFINEGQFVDIGIVTELLGRCARYPSKKNGPGATWFGGFIDLNAPEEGHWIPYMRGDMPLPPDADPDTRRRFQKPPGWKFFVQPPGLIEKWQDGHLSYEPNPLAENQKWLAEPYIEKIGGWERWDIDMRVLNKVGLTRHGKPVYPQFAEREHVLAEDIEPQSGIPITIGLDFGVQPAAAFCQLQGDSWFVLSELLGDYEPAEEFAPRVARHLAQRYPGFRTVFYGDPRGGDRNQVVTRTAYDIWDANGMHVLPATPDNDPELRRSTTVSVLRRRRGLQINPSCLQIKTGLAGGYHYERVVSSAGRFHEKPAKNHFSHIVEALENALIGGGEGMSVLSPGNVTRLQPYFDSKPRKVVWRR